MTDLAYSTTAHYIVRDILSSNGVYKYSRWRYTFVVDVFYLWSTVCTIMGSALSVSLISARFSSSRLLLWKSFEA